MVELTTERLVPETALMVFPEPSTETVPPADALNPVAEVTSISRPPLLKVVLVPELDIIETGVDAPVFKILETPAKVMLTPELALTRMPELVAVDERLPLKVIVPDALELMSINLPVLFLDKVPLWVMVPGVQELMLIHGPLGLVMGALANVNDPEHPFKISMPASPPLSVVVPLKR